MFWPMFLDAQQQTPPATWLNFAILVITLASGIWQHFSSRAAKEDRKEQKELLNNVALKTDIVSLNLRSTSQPLGEALLENAINLERIAYMTKSEDDILAAVEARRRSNRHIAEQAEIDAAKVRDQENKQKVIDAFLKDQQDRQRD